MPSKYFQRKFETGKYYHLWNRGTSESKIFRDDKDMSVFALTLSYYLRYPTGNPLSRVAARKPKTLAKYLTKVPKPSVHLIAYTLLPDHFHLILHQFRDPSSDTSISNLMRRLSITYAMHYNDKHKTTGNIFQSKYKNVSLTDKNTLLELTKYLHQEHPDNHQFSSYPFYIGREDRPTWLQNQEILEHFEDSYPALTYEEYVRHSPPKLELLRGLTLD